MQWVKGIGALLAVIVSIIWMWGKATETRLGANGNNGVTGSMPMPSPKMRKAFEKMRDDPPPSTEGRDMTDPAQRAEVEKEVMKKLDAEEQAEARKMFKDMQERMKRVNSVLGPEQSRALMMTMSERFRGMGGPRGPRPAQPQSSNP